jgi:hypothetical protein
VEKSSYVFVGSAVLAVCLGVAFLRPGVEASSSAHAAAKPNATSSKIAENSSEATGESLVKTIDLVGEFLGRNAGKPHHLSNERGTETGTSIVQKIFKEARETQAVEFEFLVAIVPDARDAQLAYDSDQTIEAIRMAIQAEGYLPDAYRDPWRPSSADGPPALAWGAPGVLFFRRDELRPRSAALSAKPDTSQPYAHERKLLLVFLVSETPARGVDKLALYASLDMVAAHAEWSLSDPSKSENAARSDRLRLIGPYASGTASSLSLALKTWHAQRCKDGKSTPFVSIDITSGTVTGSRVRQMLENALQADLDDLSNTGGCSGRTSPAVKFRTTVHPDRLLQETVFDYLKDERAICPCQVALLSDEYGAEASKDAARTRDAKRAKPAKQSCPEDCTKPIMMGFPMHVADMRAAQPNADTHPAGFGEELPQFGRGGHQLSLGEEGKLATSAFPVHSSTTMAANDLALSNVLRNIGEMEVRAVGVLATDPRDVAFLVKEVRKQFDSIQVFVLSSDRIFTHPDLSFFDGTIVASTYPLVAENQRRTLPFASNSLVMFRGEYAQGEYNATYFLMNTWRTDAIEYATPFKTAEQYQRLAPPIWLSVIANGQIWPLSYRTFGGCQCVDSADDSYCKAACELCRVDQAQVARSLAFLPERSRNLAQECKGYDSVRGCIQTTCKLPAEPAVAASGEPATNRERAVMWHMPITRALDCLFLLVLVVSLPLTFRARQLMKSVPSMQSWPHTRFYVLAHMFLLLVLLGALVACLSVYWVHVAIVTATPRSLEPGNRAMLYAAVAVGAAAAWAVGWHIIKLGRAVLGIWRLKPPRQPAPSERTTKWSVAQSLIGHLCIATILVIAAYVSFKTMREAKIGDTTGLTPAGISILSRFERARHLGSGVSLLAPFGLVSLGFLLWLGGRLRQVDVALGARKLGAWHGTLFETPGSVATLEELGVLETMLEARDTAEGFVPSFLVFSIAALFAIGGWVIATWTLVAFEPAWTLWLYRAVFWLLVACVICGCGRVLATWLALKKVLVILTAHAVRKAFERLSGQLTDAIVGHGSAVKVLWQRYCSAILNAKQAAHEKTALPDLLPSVLEQEVDVLRRYWNHGTKSDDSGPHEDFLAVRIATFITYIRNQIGTLLAISSLCTVPIVVLMVAYPLQGSSRLIAVGLVFVLGVVCTSLSVFVQMNRDEIMSRLSGTTPGEVTVDRSFVGGLLLHGIVPLLGILATQFPSAARQFVTLMGLLNGLVK